MNTFAITFKTDNPEVLEASLVALAEFYGGYKPNLIDPQWTRQPDQPDEPLLIANPQSRDDFVRECILKEFKQRIVAHSFAKATANMGVQVQAGLQQLAEGVTVE